jgi:hypothetical protein
MLALLGIRMNPFVMGAIALAAIAVGVLIHHYFLAVIGGVLIVIVLGRLVLAFQDGRPGRGGAVR